MTSDKDLDQILNMRYFKNHSEDLVESIISKAANIKQEKTNEFTAILRNIVLPEPRVSLSLCLAASFLIGIFSNQTLEASLFSDVSEFMYYGGEIL